MKLELKESIVLVPDKEPMNKKKTVSVRHRLYTYIGVIEADGTRGRNEH